MLRQPVHLPESYAKPESRQYQSPTAISGVPHFGQLTWVVYPTQPHFMFGQRLSGTFLIS